MSEKTPLWMKISSAVHQASVKGHKAIAISLSPAGKKEMEGFGVSTEERLFGLPVSVNENQPDPFVLTFAWAGVPSAKFP